MSSIGGVPSLDGVSERLERLRWRARRAFEGIRGSEVSIEPYRPADHGALISYSTEPGFEEQERYWVNAPFAFVAVDYDPEENEHRYRAVEPELDGVERRLLDNLFEDIRNSLIYSDDGEGDPSERLLRRTAEQLSEYGVVVEPDTFYRLFYYLRRTFSGYEQIDPLMEDPHIEDISCDGYNLPIFVYHDKYDNIETNVSFEEEALDSFVVRLAQQSSRHISIGTPVSEVTLPDGSRGELALGREVTPRGSAFTIRKYSEEPFTPIDLIDYQTFNLDQMAYLWLAIENNKSLIFAGGTASGKTTSMNAASMFVPPRSKVITIEDTRELTLYHDNWLSSVTRESAGDSKDITMYDLLRSSLRHRPEYIIVGEVRGDEAITLFQAMNTGHTTFSTMHADSVQTVINRLENEPINVPRAMIRSLDILCVQTLTYVDDQRVRRNQVIAEIEGIDQRTGDLDYSPAFSRNANEDTFSRESSIILDEIREDRGWSRTELLREFRNRKRVLAYLHEHDVGDYRRFTALVNEYYSHPERVLERVEQSDADIDI